MDIRKCIRKYDVNKNEIIGILAGTAVIVGLLVFILGRNKKKSTEDTMCEEEKIDIKLTDE